MTFEEALKVVPEAEQKAITAAVKEFRAAALKVFGLETWRQKASIRIIIQDDGHMALQPRLNWDDPPKPS
jgi:hypothetical protein